MQPAASIYQWACRRQDKATVRRILETNFESRRTRYQSFCPSNCPDQPAKLLWHLLVCFGCSQHTHRSRRAITRIRRPLPPLQSQHIAYLLPLLTVLVCNSACQHKKSKELRNRAVQRTSQYSPWLWPADPSKMVTYRHSHCLEGRLGSVW